MTLTISTETIPVVLDADGVARIGGTRVTLDAVVAAFVDGATAEEMAHQYPSLRLADIYSVIAYYLRRRSNESDAVLAKDNHGARTHLSLAKDAPEPRRVEHLDEGRIVETPLVGGLHHRYRRRAA